MSRKYIPSFKNSKMTSIYRGSDKMEDFSNLNKTTYIIFNTNKKQCRFMSFYWNFRPI